MPDKQVITQLPTSVFKIDKTTGRLISLAIFVTAIIILTYNNYSLKTLTLTAIQVYVILATAKVLLSIGNPSIITDFIDIEDPHGHIDIQEHIANVPIL